MRYRHVLAVSAGCGIAVALPFAGFALRAWADGIPSSPLHYSGTLLEGGQPATGSRQLGVALYTAGAGGTPVCSAAPASVDVIGGRFRIQLPDTCKTQVNVNPNLYVEVADGAIVFPRTQVGAVPYAVEADHAVNATAAASAIAAAYAADAGHASTADNATNSTHASSADTATLTSGVAPDAPIAATTTGMLAASATTTKVLTFTSGGTYLLSARLYGLNTDVTQTYVVHVPGNSNLNVNFAPLLSSSYFQGSITLATQNGQAGFTLNDSASYTLDLTFTAGGSSVTWSYAVARLM